MLAAVLRLCHEWQQCYYFTHGFNKLVSAYLLNSLRLRELRSLDLVCTKEEWLLLVLSVILIWNSFITLLKLIEENLEVSDPIDSVHHHVLPGLLRCLDAQPVHHSLIVWVAANNCGPLYWILHCRHSIKLLIVTHCIIKRPLIVVCSFIINESTPHFTITDIPRTNLRMVTWKLLIINRFNLFYLLKVFWVLNLFLRLQVRSLVARHDLILYLGLIYKWGVWYVWSICLFVVVASVWQKLLVLFNHSLLDSVYSGPLA